MRVDILLTLGVLAAALWLALRGWRLRPRALALIGAFCLSAMFVVVQVGQSVNARAMIAAEMPGIPLVDPVDGYEGSKACQACHPSEHASWRDSYHSSMTQLPTSDSVRAPFDGSVLKFLQYRYRVERRGDEFWIVTDNPRWADAETEPRPIERQVVLVTGSHHQQLFWFRTQNGRSVGRFPFFYRIAEQRWVPFHSALLTKSHTATEPGAYWNTACIRCHSTHSRGRLGDAEATDSRVAEFGIACESCHGPGQRHIEVNRNLLRRYAFHFGLRGGDDGDPTIVNPARLSAARSIDVCGQCHSVHAMGSKARGVEWSERGFPYRPGDDLQESRFIFDPAAQTGLEPAVIHALNDPHFVEDHFWPDGVATINGREYLGVKRSPCFASGEFTCLTCHDMHQSPDDPRPAEQWADDQIQLGKEGNEACLDCHPALRDGLEAHTHHETDSPGSLCYNCHMSNTTYGLLKATRTHFIESPNVSSQLASRRPNACNLCHLDRPLTWTAKTLEDWYGQPPPALEDPEHHRTGDGLLMALRGDAGQRALLAWHFGWESARRAAGQDWMAPVLAELLVDPYEAVRAIAYRSLRTLDGYEDMAFDFLAPARSRRKAREDARSRWRGAADLPDLRDPASMERFLLDSQGQVMRSRLTAILAQRDNRRIFRAE